MRERSLSSKSGSARSATRWRSGGALIGLVCMLVATITGCASANPPAAAPSQASISEGATPRPSTPVATRSATPTTTVAPSPTVAPAKYLRPGDGWTGFGPVLQQAGYGVTADGIEGVARLFSPRQGQMVIDAATLLSSQEVTEQGWTLAGSAQEPYLVGLATVRVPADGLEPEAWVTQLLAVELVGPSGSLLNATEVVHSGCTSAVYTGTLAGSYGDAVAFAVQAGAEGTDCDSHAVTASGWNPRTGEQQWSRAGGSVRGATRGSLLLTTSSYDDRCEIVAGVSPITGADLFEYRAADFMQDGRCTSIDVLDYVGDGAVYTGRAQHGLFWSLRTQLNEPDSLRTYDAVSGSVVAMEQPLQLYDTVDKLAGIYGQSFGTALQRGLDVYDPVSGTNIFSLDVERFGDLDPRVNGLVDGYLYMSTDDQDLKVDVTTGEVVSKTASVYPVDVIGEYAYLSDGTIAPLPLP